MTAAKWPFVFDNLNFPYESSYEIFWKQFGLKAWTLPADTACSSFKAPSKKTLGARLKYSEDTRQIYETKMNMRYLSPRISPRMVGNIHRVNKINT